MKKKRGKKGKVNSKKKNFLSKDNLLVFGVVAVFVVCLILLGFVNVGNNVTATGQGIAGLEDININSGDIGTFLTNFINPEAADPMVVKWITFFTFALAIWGIMSLFFKKGKGGILKLLSLPIAFAMVYLLRPEEIFAGLIGYSALGMTLIVSLPFVAIIFFSVRLLEGKLTAAKVVFELMVWYFYLAFLIYFLIRAFFVAETYSVWILLIIAIGIVVSIIAIVKNKAIRNWIARLNRESLAKEIEDVQSALGARERGQWQRGRDILGQSRGEKRR